MERELFDWEGWDQQDTMDFTFYNVTLKVPVGPFPAGEKFDSALIAFNTGVLKLYRHADDETPAAQFKLRLTVEGPLGQTEVERPNILGLY